MDCTDDVAVELGEVAEDQVGAQHRRYTVDHILTATQGRGRDMRSKRFRTEHSSSDSTQGFWAFLIFGGYFPQLFEFSDFLILFVILSMLSGAILEC